MPRPTWEEIPADLRQRVRETIGAVVSVEAMPEGIMPGLAARLSLSSGGRVFVRALPDTVSSVYLLYKQLGVGRAFEAARVDAPAPRLLQSPSIAGWVTVVHECVTGPKVSFSPGSPDLVLLPRLFQQLLSLPVPQGALFPLEHNPTLDLLRLAAKHMLGDRRGAIDRQACELLRAAWIDLDAVGSDVLTHFDLRPGNVVRTPGTPTGLTVLDWSYTHGGAAWMDVALLAPRLVGAGWRPCDVEVFLGEFDTWATAPPDMAAALVSGWTSYQALMAVYGPTTRRDRRRRAFRSGVEWLAHCLG